MDRSFCESFHSAPCRDWFQFDEYDFCYVPHRRLAFTHRLVCCFYRRPSAEELATNAENACWRSFSLAFRLQSTPWWEYCAHRWSLAPWQAGNPCDDDVYRGERGACFAVDDVYCGEDFVMVQLGYSQCLSMRFHDMSYRWMVVWIHHGNHRCSRHGQLLRRPTLADFKATSFANSRRQPWLSSVLNLAGLVQWSPRR
jgi:hypothetical protein